MKNNIIKKSLILFLASSVFLSACGRDSQDPFNENAQANTDGSKTINAKANANQDFDEEEYESFTTYTYEDIEQLNEGIEINSLYDADGFMIFLGNKYCEEKIENWEDALNSLYSIADLIGLDDNITLTYDNTNISPITGNIYYTFYQTGCGIVDGQEVTGRYFNTLVKVFTDKDGNSLGLSADIGREYESGQDYEELIPMDEAIQGIEDYLGSDLNVYADSTEFVYWNDEGTVNNVSTGKISPAWIVYADASYDENNIVSKPYQAFVLSALPSYSDEFDIQILETYYTDSINSDDLGDSYVSELFFDGFTDAGIYEYEINTDWIKKCYKNFPGGKTLKVNVPVMYSAAEDLYYMGNCIEKIACTNAYDYASRQTMNCYVTDDPSNKDSWHFQISGCDDITYFDDPDYVLASFSTYCNVYNMFADRYNFNSVDTTGMPLLLEVYGCSYEYPKSIEDFEYNAYNLGQQHDWGIMVSSPGYSGCVDPAAMGHEYTHGINSQLTSTQYLNESGALMEAYADIIGELISEIYGYIPDGYMWSIDGYYAETMRSMSNPYEFDQPKYLGGEYYVNPIDSATGSLLDHGGVHTNSGIGNYLCYSMSNPTIEGYEDCGLTIEENLDCWFETLYCSNYLSDFYDEAHYLKFAAKCVGIDSEKQDYLNDLLVASAMIEDDNDEYTLAFDEDYEEYTLNLNFLDDDVYDALSVGFSMVSPDFTTEYPAGGDNESITYRAPKDSKLIPMVCIGDYNSSDSLGSLLIDTESKPVYNIDYDGIVMDVGDTFTIEGYDLIRGSFDDEGLIEYDDDSATIEFYEPGYYYVSAISLEDDSSYVFLHFIINE